MQAQQDIFFSPDLAPDKHGVLFGYVVLVYVDFKLAELGWKKGFRDMLYRQIITNGTIG